MMGADFVNRPLNVEDGDDAWNEPVVAPGTGSPVAAWIPRFIKL